MVGGIIPLRRATSSRYDGRLGQESAAGIEPFGWVINKCLTASGTHDPLLRLRLARERTQIARVQNGLAKRAFMIGWRSKPPIGVGELQTLS
jgi:arsenite-transporting ATPase